MRKLLDITDRRTRLLQQGLMAACGFLGGIATVLLVTGALPTVVAGLVVCGAVVLFVVAAGIKQRWEIDYRGHRIRFENSPVRGEKLFLDEGLVATGGFGRMLELRAPIRVGEGAGDTIVALVHAGVREFRLRLFVETEALDSAHAAALVPTGPHVHPTPDVRGGRGRPETSQGIRGPGQDYARQTRPGVPRLADRGDRRIDGAGHLAALTGSSSKAVGPPIPEKLQ